MSTSDSDPAQGWPGAGGTAAPSEGGHDASQGQYPPGYGQPGYGQQGYDQQPYGQPAYGQQVPGYGPPVGYAPPPQFGRPTNTMAILALVMAFIFPPAGLVLGVLARKQIAQTGEDGDGLALAGIIVGGLVTAFFVLMIVLMLVAFAGAMSFATP